MLDEFKVFLIKTNALALAVGVIIGVALGAVVNSLVADIIMPPIGLILGGVDFAALRWVLDSSKDVAISYGAFLNTVISFVVIAFVVFWISRMFLKEEAAAPTKSCPFCKEANAVDASKCKFCTSAL
jgi:large conductance mechanosensitive channel